MGQINNMIHEQNVDDHDGEDTINHGKISVNSDPSVNNCDEAPTPTGRNNRETKSKNPFHLPVIRSPACISLIVYGFLHFSGMIGIVIFLPPLLTESFKPADESDDLLTVLAQEKVTTALAIFGGGGILGDVTLGVILTFGPLATRHFGVFVANNVVMLTFAGNFNNCS